MVAKLKGGKTDLIIAIKKGQNLEAVVRAKRLERVRKSSDEEGS